MDLEPISLLLIVSGKFNTLEIEYYVGGSVASSLQGVIRATNDIDIIADIPLEKVNDLVREFQQEFYIDELMIREAIRHQSSFNMIHLETMIKVDIFVRSKSPFDESQWNRRRSLKLNFKDDTASINLTSPEDTILQKLRWFQQGSSISDRQWNDVLGVIKVQASKLDFSYLNHWAQELGVSDLLEKAVEDSGIEPFK